MSLQPKIRVLRALSARIAKRALRLFTIVDGVLLALLFTGIWVLTYFFSSWWWLLLILYIPLLIVSLFIYLIASFTTARLYRERISTLQRQQLDSFTGKIIELLEARGMGWWWFATLCVRDLLLYRELRTLNELLATATGLKHDFDQLETIL